MRTPSMLLLPGDGIGKEIMDETRRIMERVGVLCGYAFEIEEDLVGGAAIDALGTPLADETLERARRADVILHGACGGPKWDSLPFEEKPERGLLRIRRELDLFANLRPAICFDALADASTLKREHVDGLDVLIVRELTSGLYFGEPRGIETLPSGERRGINTQSYTTSEIRRVARVAFDLAGKRSGRLCSAEKSNVMESGVLWREEVTALGEEYPEIELVHMYADNCAMQLLRNPKQFDVIVTDNLFGDILSDEAAMLTGSLGMLPSASLGVMDGSPGRAFYEPVHGSAPDIEGKGIANPLAMIQSFAMALRYSFNDSDAATLLEKATARALSEGARTPDIAVPGETALTTREMGDAVLAAIDSLA